MSAAAEEGTVVPRVYTSKQGADRIGSDVITTSTLERLARNYEVEHTRNGRLVGWTEAQLAGAVAHMATKRQPRQPEPPPRKNAPEASRRQRGDIAPLESKPGRRYQTANA